MHLLLIFNFHSWIRYCYVVRRIHSCYLLPVCLKIVILTCSLLSPNFWQHKIHYIWCLVSLNKCQHKQLVFKQCKFDADYAIICKRRHNHLQGHSYFHVGTIHFKSKILKCRNFINALHLSVVPLKLCSGTRFEKMSFSTKNIKRLSSNREKCNFIISHLVMCN